MKICGTCGRKLPLSKFSKNGKLLRSNCKDCVSISSKNRYRLIHEEKKNYIDERKTPCSKCGEARKYLIDFHHVNSEEKEFSIASQIIGTKKLESIKEELDIEISKCITLCSNCHREFHYLERSLNLNIDDYLNSFEPNKVS